MHPKALMNLCATLIQRALTFEHPADRVVSAFFQENRQLGSRERGALAETVYALLRQRLLFQHFAQSGKWPMERRLALLAWRGDDRVLEANFEGGERDWLTNCRAIDRSSLAPKLRHNLPDWLADALRAQVGEAEFDALAASLLEPAPLDLRVNTLTAKREAVLAELADQGAVATPFSPWGIRLQGKPNVNHWPQFKSGWVEVQDEGSQLLALLLDAKRGEMVADFCAGAGGKTLALGAAMRNTGRLYAFDVSGHRLEALRPRLARSGLSNVYPIQIAHERDERVKRLRGKLDRVLVDAPCSGLGTLRRNPDMKWRQSPQTVASLVPQQQSILQEAAKLVKSGGRLVYATCSLLEVENEGVASAFEALHPEFERLDAGSLLQPAVAKAQELVTGGALRLWPHQHGCDGFFAVAWKKR